MVQVQKSHEAGLLAALIKAGAIPPSEAAKPPVHTPRKRRKQRPKSYSISPPKDDHFWPLMAMLVGSAVVFCLLM